MHERYLFPVVVLSLALFCFGPRYLPVAAGSGLAVFANVFLSLTWGWDDGTNDLPPIPALDRDIVPRALAVMTLLLFAFMAWHAMRGRRRDVPRAVPDRPHDAPGGPWEAAAGAS